MNPKRPNHISKKSSPGIFDAILSMDRLFDFRLDDPDLEINVGDFITFKEHDPEQGFTGRQLTRRISYVLHTGDLDLPEDALTKFGLLLVGLVPTEYRLLRSVLQQSFIATAAVEKREADSAAFQLVDGPHYLPSIVCPQFDIESLLLYANVDRWPIGLYSVQWMIDIREDGDDPTVEISDIMVWSWTKTDKKDEEFEIIELDAFALRVGDVRTMDGEEKSLLHPQQLDDLEETEQGDDEEAIDFDETNMIEYWSDDRLTEALGIEEEEEDDDG